MASQHVVIIGGSSGIGFATSHELRERGYEVTIGGRNEKRLAEAQAKLRGASSVRIDGADASSVRDAFAKIPRFDHLVLAVGSHKGLGPFAQISLDEVRQGFEEKTFPHFLCAQAALPYLRKDGSITFISAVTGQAALPGSSGIGIANAAIAALAPILAVELKPLRVNAVSPGLVETHYWEFLPEDQRSAVFAQYRDKTPVGHNGRPDDIANAIAFLISDTYVTGHVLICDGGLRFGA